MSGENTLFVREQGGQSITLKSGLTITNENGLGAVAGTGVSLSTERSGLINITTITLSSLSVTMTDATTNGCHGTQKIYDFPEGVILIHGAWMNLTTLAGSGGIADGAALVGSIGSAAVGTNNATLTTTEADIIASTAGTLTSGAGTLVGVGPGSGLVGRLDGHTTPADAILNLAVPDADSSASDTVAVSGTVVLAWTNIGDFT